ncbi:MAG: phosphoribosyl-AMP cyclohydrolase [Candidatus Omnitrophota bacterium]
MSVAEKLNFNDQGLIPAIIQDDLSGKVLTLCYMNSDAISRSLDEGRVYVYRRSKGRLMLKGETSGCVQRIRAVYVDCEGNSLLFRVDQEKAACHAGYFTCYFTKIEKDGKRVITEERVFDPKDVYKN